MQVVSGGNLIREAQALLQRANPEQFPALSFFHIPMPDGIQTTVPGLQVALPPPAQTGRNLVSSQEVIYQ